MNDFVYDRLFISRFEKDTLHKKVVKLRLGIFDKEHARKKVTFVEFRKVGNHNF